MKTKTSILAFPAFALTLAFFISTNADEIDWERAKSLRQKVKSGQPLSEEDNAYLEKAKQARAGSRAPGGNGTKRAPPFTRQFRDQTNRRADGVETEQVTQISGS